MLNKQFTPALAEDIAPRATTTFHPMPFAVRVEGRVKRRLGDHFGITTFGVNLTTLPPGCQSALLHRHSEQEEFVYILSGTATLRNGETESEMGPGSCVGFRPADSAHHFVNQSDRPVLYLEVGDRPEGDAAEYPEDDLIAHMTNTGWAFTHRDGTPFSRRSGL